MQEGNRRFVADKLDGKLQDSGRRGKLTAVQSPYAITLCGQSYDAGIGTGIIVVLGHESCGAVTAAMSGGDSGYNLNHLQGHITPALHATKEDASLAEVVKKNAELTAQELSNRSKIIGDAVSSGKVEIIPTYYNLGSGKVDFL
ncbi:MAG: carbonic anhydrase [Bacteroidota bacterium]